MNELEVFIKNLPTNNNIVDVSNFVLFSREQIKSVQAEIRAMDKVHIAQEVRDQKN